MAVDVERFVTPEQSFAGLHKAADTQRDINYRNERERQQQLARKGAASSYLTSMLDQKDYLTGTYYDPEIVKQLQETLLEGAKLADEGADIPTMMMALAPRVSKLNEYSTKAKLVNTRLKEQLQLIPSNSGYDKSKLEQEARKMAFLDSEGKLKDISNLDPQTDFLTETIKIKPYAVTNSAGIDRMLKGYEKFTEIKTIKRTNERGGSSFKKMKVTSPSWMDVDNEGNLTPKFQIAIDDGKPVEYDFVDEKGAIKKAPVRLLDERIFNSMMSENPDVADWVRGQVMQAGEGSDLNSPQAKMAARAILYTELKNRGGGLMEDASDVKLDPVTRLSVTVNSGSGTSQINDIYGRVESTVKEDAGRGMEYTRFNKLKSDEQALIKEFINKDMSSDEKFTGDKDIALKLSEDGEDVMVYKVSTPIQRKDFVPENLITTLPRTGMNLKVQPSVKEKRKVVEQENANPSEPQKKGKYPLPKGKPRTVKQNGVTYSWNEKTGQYE